MNWTVASVAARLQVHATTVLRWLHQHRFPHAYKVRGQWEIPEADVLQIEQDMMSPNTIAANELRELLGRTAHLYELILETLIYQQIKTPLKHPDMRKFLARHGKLESTTRNWDDLPLTSFRDALLFALQREYQNRPHDPAYRLRQCDVDLCVCHALLTEDAQ